MRTALQRVRLDKVSTTKISLSSGIPTRTLRRYVNFSKNPDSIFYIEEPEEEEQDDDRIVWKPQTAVPMFKFWSNDTDVAVSDGIDFSDDVVDVTSPSSPSSLCDNDDNDKVVVSGSDISAFSAASVAAGGNSSAVVSVADVGNFADVDGNAIFDNTEFDQLFQDFLNDDTFAADTFAV